MNDNNLFAYAHSLPNYKHSIINTPGVFYTELLAKHLEVNMGKKLKDIDFHFKEKTSNYNNVTAKYLQKERDLFSLNFGCTPRSKVIDRPLVDWVRNKQLNVSDYYREKLYIVAVKDGK